MHVTYYAIFAVGVTSQKVGWRLCDGFVEIVTLFQSKLCGFTTLFQTLQPSIYTFLFRLHPASFFLSSRLCQVVEFGTCVACLDLP